MPPLGGLGAAILAARDALGLSGVSKAGEILVMLVTEFGLLVAVSLLTRPRAKGELDPFFARLLTPVGNEPQVAWTDAPPELPESATLGLDGWKPDYRKASGYGYRGLQRWGFEVPRMTWFDWGGFALAWAFVGGLVGTLAWLSGWGA